MAIHAAAVLLLLALTFPDSIPGPPSPPRAVILLAPVTPRLLAPSPPAVRVAVRSVNTARRLSPPATPLSHRLPPRPFRAPALRDATAPHRPLLQVPALEIPPPAIPRPLLPAAELARLPVAPRPPLPTDNLTSLAASAAIPSIAIQPAGFTAASSAPTPTHAVIRSSGFERVSAEPPPRPPAQALTPALPLQPAGFDDATRVAARAGVPSLAATLPAQPVTRPVEILSKPRPAYTEEARRRRIEGQVLLKVLFAASGQARVLAMVRGLGYGLDENAAASAEAIRFRPAERAGIPADSTAIVHIVFQLAY